MILHGLDALDALDGLDRLNLVNLLNLNAVLVEASAWDAGAAIVRAAGAAAVVFATTNIDDLVLLSAFFGDDAFRPRAVVLGQILGMTALMLVSVGAAFGLSLFPAEWVALLGAVPLALGVASAIALVRASAASAPHQVTSHRRLAALVVAGTTVANGGDNVGVYVPLFASTPSVIGVYAVVFAALTLVWCFAGWCLARNAVFGAQLRRLLRVLLPFVLVVVGLHVLAGAYPLLVR